jgi:hypothetical protein
LNLLGISCYYESSITPIFYPTCSRLHWNTFYQHQRTHHSRHRCSQTKHPLQLTPPANPKLTRQSTKARKQRNPRLITCSTRITIRSKAPLRKADSPNLCPLQVGSSPISLLIPATSYHHHGNSTGLIGGSAMRSSEFSADSAELQPIDRRCVQSPTHGLVEPFWPALPSAQPPSLLLNLGRQL